MPLNVFLIMLFIQWWASWYPGAEPGGGSYIVQRMASCKDERHSLLATLWFQIAHYCVRPWPWIMIAFAALALYPDLRSMDDPGVGFPMLIRDVAPPGIRGLILVSFFASAILRSRSLVIRSRHFGHCLQLSALMIHLSL